ncbi:MAG: glycogen/starch/alpha-glucan phosphorylase [Rubritepida sp.]|nr:glycogen/starch/alpha-glucan phosphorylase [Rubritepida sp.]
MTPPDAVNAPASADAPGTVPAGAAALRDAILRKLTFDIGKSRAGALDRDWFMATALAVRERLVEPWLRDLRGAYDAGQKQVYYLSLEFLIGRLLRENLSNLGLMSEVRAALVSLDVNPALVEGCEPDAALGNGGLGRLAACFMESLSSLSIPAIGYGIRYDYGLFKQIIHEGWQEEFPEDWLNFQNPWEFARPEIAHPIGFGGSVEEITGEAGEVRHVWKPAETVLAVAYDTPIVGWRGKHVNTLRLWSARAPDPLRLEAFNRGDHIGAVSERARAEAISRVLYPADDSPQGLELRLRQEFFFSSAALQDLIRRHLRVYGDLRSLPERVAIQLNDTHPAIVVAELMRILLDDHGIEWHEAWRITRGTISYTNHTLLPEALESWPVALMERLLPRHMQIIYLINAVHLNEVAAAHPGDLRLLASVSLIEEHNGRRVRMGHLAFVGSHKVNGVSALHSELLKKTVFRDFHQLDPGRITNKTNGVTFRRWLQQCNPCLTDLLVERIGPGFLDDPEALRALEPYAGDAGFQARFAEVKRTNKQALAALIRERTGIRVDPSALFDIHIKRIHEYKRQLLNLLETVALYDAIRAEPHRDWPPRVKVFAGKAAASYHRAKLIIKLAHDVARLVNRDPTVRDRLKVVFLPNYNVSLAELIIPAADLSEQISTAGMEASGTGNMKLGLNGALTIGTLDGANVEMLEHVGAENIFIFGLTTEQVEARRRQGWHGQEAIAQSFRLAQVMDQLASGVLSPDDRDRYAELVRDLREHDHFLVTADFDSYFATQRMVDARWMDQPAWQRSAILNTARLGWFSSDRTIREYAAEIWRVPAAG